MITTRCSNPEDASAVAACVDAVSRNFRVARSLLQQDGLRVGQSAQSIRRGHWLVWLQRNACEAHHAPVAADVDRHTLRPPSRYTSAGGSARSGGAGQLDRAASGERPLRTLWYKPDEATGTFAEFERRARSADALVETELGNRLAGQQELPGARSLGSNVVYWAYLVRCERGMMPWLLVFHQAADE